MRTSDNAPMQRLGRLVDRALYQTDAQYHADMRRFQQWLEVTRMAMEDETVDPRVIERVLNRVVYGAPDGADAYERIERHQRAADELARASGLNVGTTHNMVFGRKR